MAERLVRLADDGQERAESAVSVSAGAADAGRIPALGADGKLHSSMLGALGGGAVSKVFDRVGDVVAVVGDYAASLVSNDSSVVGATVKDALQTLGASLAALVPATRNVLAGAGLTGGGTLDADLTLNVGTSDSSIIAYVDSIRVGTINDSQHGQLGGGNTHALAIANGAAGFLSGTEKAKLQTVKQNANVVAYPYHEANEVVRFNGKDTGDIKGGSKVILDDAGGFSAVAGIGMLDFAKVDGVDVSTLPGLIATAQSKADAAFALGGGAVSKVFDRVGEVVATLGDYAASLVSNDSTVSGATVKEALQTLAASISAIPAPTISTVFGRAGEVLAAVNDYTTSQIKNTTVRYNNTSFPTLTDVIDSAWIAIYNLQNFSYVCLGTSSGLANERALAVGTGVQMNDGGAGGALTLTATGNGSENYQPGTAYALVLADAGRTISLNNLNPITLTLPATATVAMADGTECFAYQAGPGQVSFVAASGCSLDVPPGKLARSKGIKSTVRVWKITASVWTLDADGLEDASPPAVLSTELPPDVLPPGSTAVLGDVARAAREDHQHVMPLATDSAGGAISSGDFTKLAGIAAGANVGPAIATTSPAAVLSPGSAAVLGAVTARAAREDHQHVMPAASGSVAGAMSAADYTKLLGVAAGANVGPAIATTSPAAVLSPGSAAVLGAVTARAAREDHQHVMPAASGSVAGAMSAADYTKLLGVAAGATNTAAPPAAPAAAPPDISATGYIGGLTAYARQDHYHGHGDIAGTATVNDHHTAATASVYGFQSPANFVKTEKLSIHAPDSQLSRRSWNPCWNNSAVHEVGYACFMWGGLTPAAVLSGTNRFTASPRIRYSSNTGTYQLGGIATNVAGLFRGFPFRWYTRFAWVTSGYAHTIFCGMTASAVAGNTVWSSQYNTLGVWRNSTYSTGYYLTCGGPSNVTNVGIGGLSEAIVAGGVDLLITGDSSRADVYWRNAAGSTDDWTLGASQTNTAYLPGPTVALGVIHSVSTWATSSPAAAIDIAYTSLDSP